MLHGLFSSHNFSLHISHTAQAADFGGWPELNELPLEHMTKQHIDILAAKCSNRLDIEMPNFSDVASSPSGISHTVSPGPRAQVDADTITPSPGVALKEAAASKNATAKPLVSKKQLEMHKQWQAVAESLGGKDARLVVSKPEAKKLIFEALRDAFAPMNITDLHKVGSRSESMTLLFARQHDLNCHDPHFR